MVGDRWEGERQIQIRLPAVLGQVSHGTRPNQILGLGRSSVRSKDKSFICIYYVSWGPIFWPFLRSPTRAPTVKAVRGTVAVKGIFDN